LENCSTCSSDGLSCYSNLLLLLLLFHRRQDELEAKLIEEELQKRVEEEMAKRVQQLLLERKDEIEAEVLRRVEEAKKVQGN